MLNEEIEQKPLLALKPVPDNADVCGLPGALSAIESVPEMLPVRPGVKVTFIVQLAPETRLRMQLSVSPKFAVAETLTTLIATVP